MSDYYTNPRKVVDKHPSCVDIGECRPKHRGRKDTRQWCKGRVGIPHTWEWVRQRNQVEIEQRLGMRYNRITEEPVCFGCGKVEFRRRHYCAQCGEPWPELHHRVPGTHRWDTMPCVRCGAPWSIRGRIAASVWMASGSVRS
jgi:hypothetical protein